MQSSCSQQASSTTQEDDQNQEMFKPIPVTKKIYFFWAPWCGHCVEFKPAFNEFAQRIINNKEIEIIMVNCDKPDGQCVELMNKYKVDGFPTVIIEENLSFKQYDGPRTVEGLMTIVEGFGNTLDNNGPTPTGYIRTDIKESSNPTDSMLPMAQLPNSTDENTIVILNFNTSWCGHSTKFQPIWDEFTDSLNYIPNKNIKAFDIKCDDNKNEALCKQFNVEGFPSVIIVRNNDIIPYNGPRSVVNLQDAVLQIAEPNLQVANLQDAVLQDAVLQDADLQDAVLQDADLQDADLQDADLQDADLQMVEPTIIYNFNTEWCGYSKMFEPTWTEFTNSLKIQDNVKAINVKCDNDANKTLCEKYKIPGYPSIVIVSGQSYKLYDGLRTVDALRGALNL